MSPLIGLTGWLAAAASVLVAVAAQRRLRSRMEAVARACHELRGPLTAARLGLSSVAGQVRPSPVRLRAVDAELVRAAVALDDLSDPRRRTPRLAGIDRVDVPELLEDCVEAWRAVAHARGVGLSARWVGERAQVWGDRPRLAQAVENLICNGLEHGGGAVEVRGLARDGRVRVVVADQGPGLAAPVARLARSARRGGRGRGLAIAAAVAEAHGGAVTSAPAPRGARLVLDLPAASDAAHRPAR